MLFAMRPVAAKYDYYYSRARMAALTAPSPPPLSLSASTRVFSISLYEENFKDWGKTRGKGKRLVTIWKLGIDKVFERYLIRKFV